MYSRLSEAERKKAMHPDLDPLILVDIPFGKEQQISEELRSRLLSVSDEELDEMEDEHAEAVEFVQTVAHGEKELEVWLTERAAKQLNHMRVHDAHHTRGFNICFERMRSAPKLRVRVHDRVSDQQNKSIPVTLHFFKRKRSETVERPVFYTLPKDIKHCTDDEVDKVIVCELEFKKSGRYRSLKEITALPNFSIKPAFPIEQPSLETPAESVLIVPLGKFPMVATQLYTLLKHQEGCTICEVVLVYPEGATEIVAGAELVKKALQDEDKTPCRHARISRLKDIDSTDACREYQATLEDEIDRVRKDHPDCKIDLALSGGRKGMTAMTIFAAQKKHIPWVYHTLITDEQLSETIDDETTVRVLNDPRLAREERNDRLFLRAYKDKEGPHPYTKFVLFRVPVFSAGDR